MTDAEDRKPGDPQGLLDRLQRWLTAFRPPTVGWGWAVTEETYEVLRDCRDALAGLPVAQPEIVKVVMPSDEQSSMHLRPAVGRNWPTGLPGASVTAGAQHPAENTEPAGLPVPAEPPQGEPARVAEIERLLALWAATTYPGPISSLAWEMLVTLQHEIWRLPAAWEIAPPAPPWQPIKSAPKNTPLLIWAPDEKLVASCQKTDRGLEFLSGGLCFYAAKVCMLMPAPPQAPEQEP